MNDECSTPKELFNRLADIYNFTLDAAATKKNTKCKKFLSKKDDALFCDWKTNGYTWLNPPYSKSAGGILKWIDKAHYQTRNGFCRGVVCLIICDVSTASRQFAWDFADEIVELSPRVNFASPGWKKRTGGFQAYQLVIFKKHRGDKIFSRWNWKDQDYTARSSYKVDRT